MWEGKVILSYKSEVQFTKQKCPLENERHYKVYKLTLLLWFQVLVSVSHLHLWCVNATIIFLIL